jgi:hypothetical protein
MTLKFRVEITGLQKCTLPQLPCHGLRTLRVLSVCGVGNRCKSSFLLKHKQDVLLSSLADSQMIAAALA